MPRPARQDGNMELGRSARFQAEARLFRTGPGKSDRPHPPAVYRVQYGYTPPRPGPSPDGGRPPRELPIAHRPVPMAVNNSSNISDGIGSPYSYPEILGTANILRQNDAGAANTMRQNDAEILVCVARGRSRASRMSQNAMLPAVLGRLTIRRDNSPHPVCGQIN